MKIRHLLVLLLAGGLIGLTDLTSRVTVLGSFNMDALRNLVLTGIVIFAVITVTFQHKGKIPNVWRIWPYLLFVWWAGASIVWTTELGYTIREALKLIYPILVYVLARSALTNDYDGYRLFVLVRRVIGVFAIVAIVASVIGVLLSLRQGVWIWGTSRLLDFPLQIPTMAACTYILIELVGRWKLPAWRPANRLLIGMTVYVILTLTRAYIFGLLLAVTFMVTLSWRRKSRQFLVLMIGLAAVILLLTVDNPIKRRMFWHPEEVNIPALLDVATTDPGRFLSEDYVKFSGRFAYWEHVLNEARGRRPALIGAGLGSGREFIIESRFDANVVHGDYAGYLAELGYIGLGLFILLYLMTLLFSLRWMHRKRASPIKRTAASVLFGQVILASVVSLAYNSFVHIFVLHATAAIMVAIIHTHAAALNSERIVNQPGPAIQPFQRSSDLTAPG